MRKAVKKAINLIRRGRALYRRARKVVPPLVAALALIVGTDAPLYADVIALLGALGVYPVSNAAK